MKFYRFWLQYSIFDIAYNGTKEELKKELDEMYPGTLPRVEEIIFKHWEIVNEKDRQGEW